MVVLLVLLGAFLYWVAAGLDPRLGPGNAGAQDVAKAAVKHLSSNSHIQSARTTYAGADSGTGSVAEVEAHIKTDTTVDNLADILPSTCRTAQKHSIWGAITVGITFTGNLQGTDINTYFSCRDSDGSGGSDTTLSDKVRRDLALAGQASTITREGENSALQADYGQVTTTPTTLTQPGTPNSSRTFTLNGWKVTSTSNKEGQFPNTVAFEQVIAAASQASTTGTIDLDNDTLSVTGLVTDDTKSLTPETAAPVVHAVADCHAANLTTLQLNDKVQRGLSSDNDRWLSFTCNNGTWTPKHESSRGQDEAAILQKATEL
ncbi:hypothetical protein E4J66_06750 [Actinomyces viscosus]|uniref:Uncharacterized protein n=1 Tax=Actinomyces viscosus TaxID=1656 RepID=A0A3S4VEQ6_ACTVI|nr:hypothetical protein [Actinomyces viscosus]TFH52687.1 hypothetical protein E4J66_06750 [Actinomyces viscosus]VEI16817.1 Uncharacterised protein [Actinomyces viscosus]